MIFMIAHLSSLSLKLVVNDWLLIIKMVFFDVTQFVGNRSPLRLFAQVGVDIHNEIVLYFHHGAAHRARQCNTPHINVAQTIAYLPNAASMILTARSTSSLVAPFVRLNSIRISGRVFSCSKYSCNSSSWLAGIVSKK